MLRALVAMLTLAGSFIASAPALQAQTGGSNVVVAPAYGDGTHLEPDLAANLRFVGSSIAADSTDVLFIDGAFMSRGDLAFLEDGTIQLMNTAPVGPQFGFVTQTKTLPDGNFVASGFHSVDGSPEVFLYMSALDDYVSVPGLVGGNFTVLDDGSVVLIVTPVSGVAEATPANGGVQVIRFGPDFVTQWTATLPLSQGNAVQDGDSVIIYEVVTTPTGGILVRRVRVDASGNQEPLEEIEPTNQIDGAQGTEVVDDDDGDNDEDAAYEEWLAAEREIDPDFEDDAAGQSHRSAGESGLRTEVYMWEADGSTVTLDLVRTLPGGYVPSNRYKSPGLGTILTGTAYGSNGSASPFVSLPSGVAIADNGSGIIIENAEYPNTALIDLADADHPTGDPGALILPSDFHFFPDTGVLLMSVQATDFSSESAEATPAFHIPSTSYVVSLQLTLDVPTGQVGYEMIEDDGTFYPFGDAPAFEPLQLNGASAIAIEMTADGLGAWVLDTTGKVHARGTATDYGDLTTASLSAAAVALDPGETPASMSALPDGSGYWVFTTTGRATAFGAAAHYGDMVGIALDGPVIASVATPTGLGYYMLGSDGGIFTFGDAVFSGSVPQFVPLSQLAAPLVGIAPDPDGSGYWLVAADGGIFAFDADFVGSVPGVLAPGTQLAQPVVGAIAFGDAYLMVASDGGIFNFASQPFLGSLGDDPPDTPINGVAAFVT